MFEIVPATTEIINRLHKEAIPKTVRAIAAVDGDEVLGVTGFYPQEGRLVLFAGISDEARKNKVRLSRAIIKCARKILGIAKEKQMDVWAMADPDIPGADVLLKHIGFVQKEKDLYQWLGQQ